MTRRSPPIPSSLNEQASDPLAAPSSATFITKSFYCCCLQFRWLRYPGFDGQLISRQFHRFISHWGFGSSTTDVAGVGCRRISMYSKISAPRSIPCVIVPVMDQSHSLRTKEALHHRIVVAVALATHTADHVMTAQHFDVSAGVVHHTLVAVVDECRAWAFAARSPCARRR